MLAQHRPDGLDRAHSVERMIAEGLLIALAATRMAVKNDIIVGALRHHADYHPEDYLARAREQIDLLIRENEDHAERLSGGAERGAGDSDERSDTADDGRVGDGPASLLTLPGTSGEEVVARIEEARLLLLHQVYVGLGDALREELASDDRMLALVECARQDAWEEVGAAWHQLITPPPDVRREPEYQRQRAGRLQEFVYIDLAGLMVGER